MTKCFCINEEEIKSAIAVYVKKRIKDEEYKDSLEIDNVKLVLQQIKLRTPVLILLLS